jgi:hypothetical protein
VQFDKVEDAIAAYESAVEEPMYIMDRDLRIDFAPGRKPASVVPYHKLFFDGFPGTEAELRAATREFESSIISVFFCKSRYLIPIGSP